MSKLRQRVQAGLAATLCALMVVSPALGEESGAGVIPAEPHRETLTQTERALHALNRFTFGPRPGDVAAVERMGLDRWFEMQLHPERIDDSALDVRMQAFPAMQLSTAQLMERFPSPQMIRQEMRGKGGVEVPSDAAGRAIYADSLATYEARKKQAEAGAPQVAGGAAGSGVAGSGAAGSGGAGSGGAGSGGSASGMEMGGDRASQPGASAEVQAAAGEAALNEAMEEPAAKGAAGDTGASVGQDAAGKSAGVAGGGGKGGKRSTVMPMEDASVEAVLALAPAARMQRLEAMSPAELQSFRAGLRQGQRLRLLEGLQPEQLEVLAAMQAPERVVAGEALESRLIRDIYSQRQLQAVMTDFWLNHFSVFVRKNQQEPYYLPSYQRDVILPHSLGRFEDLLVATAESPAMLMYLDNWESIGPDSVAATRVARVQRARPNGQLAQALPKGINENYARELMELHTLGVNGGYTQQDVIQVARCFTGWTIDRPYRGGGGEGRPGEFVFEPNRHEPGEKVVLGQVIHEGGMNEGLEVLHILANSPATAHFVSQKLAVRFVSDTPPPALVDAMAASFLASHGDIRTVLETMFHSPLFWTPTVYRAKVKTPLEFLVSALRASDAEVKNAVPLVQAMARLGMPVYGMQTPNGYGWTADQWVSSNALISRMNFALVLSGDRLPGTQTHWPQLLGEASDSAEAAAPTAETERALEQDLLGQPAAARTRQTVLEQFQNPTAQQAAEQGFNAQPAGEAGDASGAEVAELEGMRGGGLRRVGQQRQRFLNQPETPLDTMAGLLLGSPEFQRR